MSDRDDCDELAHLRRQVQELQQRGSEMVLERQARLQGDEQKSLLLAALRRENARLLVDNESLLLANRAMRELCDARRDEVMRARLDALAAARSASHPSPVSPISPVALLPVEPAPPLVRFALESLLCRVGSWTSAKWSAHVSDELGDEVLARVRAWLIERDVDPDRHGARKARVVDAERAELLAEVAAGRSFVAQDEEGSS